MTLLAWARGSVALDGKEWQKKVNTDIEREIFLRFTLASDYQVHARLCSSRCSLSPSSIVCIDQASAIRLLFTSRSHLSPALIEHPTL